MGTEGMGGRARRGKIGGMEGTGGISGELKDGWRSIKSKAAGEGFRGGNFFVRATTMFQALGGMMDLDGFHFSRVLPWHVGFSDLDANLLTVLGFAHGFRIPEQGFTG